jgi:Glycosyltransferase family 87
MRRFFSEDASPDNYPVISQQQRAVWIGLALILQALSEFDSDWLLSFMPPFIKTLGSVLPILFIGGSFIAMAMAFRPGRLQQQAQQGSSRRGPRVILVMTLLLTIAGGIYFGRALVLCFEAPQFSNDGTSLDTNAAMLLLEGRNPYSDSNMLEIAERYSIQPNWTTPLMRGQFANRLDYPSITDFQTVLDTDIKSGQSQEFESKVSYPALSFLTLVPFAIFKDYNVLPFYLLSYLLLVTIAWKAARPEMRAWVLLLALANVSMGSSTVGGNLDVFNALLIMLCWLLRDKRWSSALFLGLAVASKQTAWFFLPFYAIMAMRHYGAKEAIYRLGIAGVIGLAINLPFIAWNPQAWLAGILAPQVDPMFPMGVGLISLSVTHVLPWLPRELYTVMEIVVMLGSLAWYWRICKQAPEAAMLLAVLPLFFAWRSLASYFYCAAFPMFALMAARRQARTQVALAAQPRPTSEATPQSYEGVLAGAHAMLNVRMLASPLAIFRSLVQLLL